MSAFTLKIIGLITMIFDHIKYVIPSTYNFITKYIGRISFPIFAFLITEGYLHTKSKEKYVFRLFLLAIVSEIPYRLLFANTPYTNTIFTLLLGLLGIILFEYFKNKEKLNKIVKILCIIITFILIIFLGNFINIAYAWFGLTIIWIFHILKPHKKIMFLAYILTTFLYYINNSSNTYIISMLFTMFSIFIILLYNGKKGAKIKYFFYIFYPLHIYILYLININLLFT